MRSSKVNALAIAVSSSASSLVMGGPISYGICQTSCNTVAGACHAAAGVAFEFSVFDAAAAPDVVLKCNEALGICSKTCAGMELFAPTP
ncbi:hypothetical protein GGX14DRAFT_553857 [Mycena pura]|uniref:Uncharacterized protein n=1 Tax=Mycena pura TaxID=153505 RepID=A0AAD7E5U7_9AGAR|nr:hypothetical protein GGX14DRAFT_553857 [Mycena pura]